MAHAGVSGRLLRDGDPTPGVKRINAPILVWGKLPHMGGKSLHSSLLLVSTRGRSAEMTTPTWRLNPEQSQSEGTSSGSVIPTDRPLPLRPRREAVSSWEIVP